MDSREKSIVRQLLTRQRICALGVVVEGAPNVGQLPFAMRPDFSTALVLASGLARHSKGLVAGAPFSALLGRDGGEGDPFQLPRLTLNGSVRPLERGGSDFAAAQAIYLAKLPTAEMLFGLGDFKLHELVVERARLVAGFGSAHSITPSQLRDLAASAPED